MKTPLTSALGTLITLASLIFAPLVALAHEADELIPAEDGVALGLAIAGGWTRSDEAVPARRLTGVTGLGDTPTDLRGWRMEHATAGLGLRWSSRLTAVLAMGWHGGDPAHVEAAWVQAEFEDPLSPLAGERGLFIGAGRNRLPLGPVITSAGHLDRFGQMPLAKRSSFNGDWIDDGLNLRWQPHLEGGWARLETVEIGAWRARRFPGAVDAPVAPVVHLRARFGDLALDGFASRLRPDGRGAHVQREGSGHLHTAPRCDQSLRDITCFSGRVDLVGASLQWSSPWPGLAVQGALLHRRERGDLSSANGSTRYRGQSTGGWIDLLWAISPRWETGLRQEWLGGRASLAGIGATRVAGDANLLPDDRSRRTTVMAAFHPHRDWRISAEVGRESVAGIGSTVVGLRLIWSPAPFSLFTPLPEAKS